MLYNRIPLICKPCATTFLVGKICIDEVGESLLCPVCRCEIPYVNDDFAKDRRKPEEVGGEHYKQGLQVTPWELQRTMVTSGNAFVDARRADAIKYTWRMKGDLAKLAEDLKKARHCLDEAIKELLKDKA